jgi:hypothetical protein
MRQPVPYRVVGLEGSEDNPILIDLDDVSLSEAETEICTSQESFDGSPENPIWILDEATVCESPECQTEANAAVRGPHGSLLDPVGTPKENMEEPQSESECGVGMQCPLVPMQGTTTTTFDSSGLPVYYFDEGRLCESPESDWQCTSPVGSPHISAVNLLAFLREVWRLSHKGTAALSWTALWLKRKALQVPHLALLSFSFETQKSRL